MQQAELELVVIDLSKRVIELERELARSKGQKASDNWVRLRTAERLTNKQWTAFLIEKAIMFAIENPTKSPLQQGVHYSAALKGYRINLTRFLEIDWSRYRD